jgi:uncharacterized membrane protein
VGDLLRVYRWRIILAALGVLLSYLAFSGALWKHLLLAVWWGLLLGLVRWWLDRRRVQRTT